MMASITPAGSAGAALALVRSTRPAALAPAASWGERQDRVTFSPEAKRIAEVQFDTAGRKRLLIKVAPITKL